MVPGTHSKKWGRRCYEVFPNELIPNVKIPIPENGENTECKNPEIIALLGKGEKTTFPPPPAKLGIWDFYVRDYYVNPTK